MESALRLFERHAVLRPLGTGEARLDGAEIEFDDLRVHRFGIRRRAEHPLRFRVRLDELDARFVTAGQPQVVNRHLVDREDRDRRAILGAHVAERRTVGDRQMLETGPEELDELADNPVLTEPFGDREHEIGGGRAFEHRADQPEPEPGTRLPPHVQHGVHVVEGRDDRRAAGGDDAPPVP